VLYVVLEDFASGSARLQAGSVIEGNIFPLVQLQRSGLLVAEVVDSTIYEAIQAYISQRGVGPREIVPYGDMLGTLLHSNGGATFVGTLTGDSVEARLGGGALSRMPHGVLTGARDGVNLTFAAPGYFKNGFEEVFINGVRLDPGVGCDYVTAESGGAGTGYDSVILAYPLITTDVPRIAWIPA